MPRTSGRGWVAFKKKWECWMWIEMFYVWYACAVTDMKPCVAKCYWSHSTILSVFKHLSILKCDKAFFTSTTVALGKKYISIWSQKCTCYADAVPQTNKNIQTPTKQQEWTITQRWGAQSGFDSFHFACLFVLSFVLWFVQLRVLFDCLFVSFFFFRFFNFKKSFSWKLLRSCVVNNRSWEKETAFQAELYQWHKTLVLECQC